MAGRERFRRRLRSELEFFADKILRIRAKDGSIIPLRLNKAQRYLHQKLAQQRERKGRVRALILKGRQQGCSTYVQARYFWRVIQTRGLRAFILTHEQEATNNLFEMAERFCTEAPVTITPTASNAKELHFADMDSGYKVGTAGNKAVGRSSTLQLFHGSEVAFWPNADQHKAGVIQAVPDLDGTEIILESTANGVGGMFYEMWKDAEAGRSDYLPIFIPWFWQDEYRRDATGFEPSETEKKLAGRYGLTNEQLAWRRAKIAELKPSDGGNPEDLFKQEYPCDPDEAFLFSGRMVFSSAQLLDLERECFKPKYRAEILAGISKNEQGRLRVWEDPKAGERYVIGADVAEGIETGDYSCADVLAVSDGRQIAQWHGHIDPDLFGNVLAVLGKHYHKALIGVERNNHGLTTLTKLRDRGYPNLYAQVDIEHRGENHETKKIGWLTTRVSKMKIIDQMGAELRDKRTGICCLETVREMATFIIDENGAYTAKSGCHDDRVMSRAIAGEMLAYAPKSKREDKPVDEKQKKLETGPADSKAGY